MINNVSLFPSWHLITRQSWTLQHDFECFCHICSCTDVQVHLVSIWISIRHLSRNKRCGAAANILGSNRRRLEDDFKESCCWSTKKSSNTLTQLNISTKYTQWWSINKQNSSCNILYNTGTDPAFHKTGVMKNVGHWCSLKSCAL